MPNAPHIKINFAELRKAELLLKILASHSGKTVLKLLIVYGGLSLEDIRTMSGIPVTEFRNVIQRMEKLGMITINKTTRETIISLNIDKLKKLSKVMAKLNQG